MRKMTFYAIFHKDSPDNFLTICQSKKQLPEFLRKFLVMEHYEHFKQWCSNRSLDTMDEKAWASYIEACVERSEIEEYKVKTIKYTQANVATILRIFCGCPTVGCSYETDLEYKYLKSKLAQQKALLDAIKKIEEEAKKERENKNVDK